MAKNKVVTSRRGGIDEFSSIVYQTVTESGANTLTFGQVQTGYGSLDKIAWIIHKIEWYMPTATKNLLLANDDIIALALVTSNLLTSLSLADASMIDLMELQKHQETQVGYELWPQPIIRNFTDLPGGGKLVLPYPLYIAIKGTSLASAGTGACRLYFTERALESNEWMELVQQTRLLQ